MPVYSGHRVSIHGKTVFGEIIQHFPSGDGSARIIGRPDFTDTRVSLDAKHRRGVAGTVFEPELDTPFQKSVYPGGYRAGTKVMMYVVGIPGYQTAPAWGVVAPNWVVDLYQKGTMAPYTEKTFTARGITPLFPERGVRGTLRKVVFEPTELVVTLRCQGTICWAMSGEPKQPNWIRQARSWSYGIRTCTHSVSKYRVGLPSMSSMW